MDADRQLVHATAVAVDGRAALIVGPSGTGKSDLALRLIMTSLHDGGRPLYAHLIADDQVVIRRQDDRLLASAPKTIPGLIEVRGLGILPIAHADDIEVALFADVDPAHPSERFPDRPEVRSLLGIAVPVVRIDALQASAPAKLVLALLRLGRP